jgi:hypothetical protein
MYIQKHSPEFIVTISKSPEYLRGLVKALIQESAGYGRHIAWYHYKNKVHLIIGGDVIEYEGESPQSTIQEFHPDPPDYGQKVQGLDNRTTSHEDGHEKNGKHKTSSST